MLDHTTLGPKACLVLEEAHVDSEVKETDFELLCPTQIN